MRAKQDLAHLAHLDTKIAICDAFESLTEEMPFDKVPVAKICDQAGISRATFYRVFEDKYDIMKWASSHCYSQGADQIGIKLTWKDGYYETERAVMRHIDFFKAAAKSSTGNSLDAYAPRARKETLTKTITELYKQPITPHMQFMIDATIDIETKAFPAWHYGKYDCSLEEMCTWVVECIPKDLFHLLEKPLNPELDGVKYKHSLLGQVF